MIKGFHFKVLKFQQSLSFNLKVFTNFLNTLCPVERAAGEEARSPLEEFRLPARKI